MDDAKSRDADGVRKHWAFISYARADEGWALWLQKRIERCRVPKDQQAGWSRAGLHGRRMAPVFLDRNELVASSDLGASLRRQLAASAHLIVVGSRIAAKRPKVDEEVRYFIELGRADKIFYFVIDGEPFAQQRGLDPALECLPPALVELHAGGRLAEPNWADVRQRHRGWGAYCRTVAGMLGVSPDVFFRRERARRWRYAMLAGFIGLLFASGVYVAVERERVAGEQARFKQEQKAAQILRERETANAEARRKQEQEGERILREREAANAEARRKDEEAYAETFRRQREAAEQERRAQAAEQERALLERKTAVVLEEARRELAGVNLRPVLGKLAAQARELQSAGLQPHAELKRFILEALLRTPAVDKRSLLPAPSPGAAGVPPAAAGPPQRYSDDGTMVAGLVDHTVGVGMPTRADVTISIVKIQTGESFSIDLPIDIVQWAISGEANLLVTCHNADGRCVARRNRPRDGGCRHVSDKRHLSVIRCDRCEVRADIRRRNLRPAAGPQKARHSDPRLCRPQKRTGNPVRCG